MLYTEWNMDDALAVAREEAYEERDKVIAQKALAEGLSTDIIQKISGLDLEIIQSLKN